MFVKNTRTSGVAKAVGGVAAAAGLTFALLYLPDFPSLAYAADATTQPSEKPAAEQVGPALPVTPTLVKEWFADLVNSDAAIRAEALTKLMSLDSGDLPILKKVVEESRPLAPAQATVLRQIVTQIFLSGDRYEAHPGIGFLGVRMEETAVSFRDAISGNTSLPSVGVVIVERMPGFAGSRMLQDGDVVLSILEYPDASMPNPEAFASLIRSMGAGAKVHFQILRQGQVIHVGATLDPRPVDADFGIRELLERRRQRVEEYWATEFASLVKEGVS